jgi:hypothetical protein
MKNAVFWDVAPCRTCVNDVSEERIASGFFCHEYGGDIFLRNVDPQKIYMAPEDGILLIFT